MKARDLINFAVGATVSDLQEHNHSPYRVNTFGLADITEVGSDHSSIRSTITDDTDASNHAISQLNEGDFSTDFGQGNMESRARSSPVPTWEYGTADISEADTLNYGRYFLLLGPRWSFSSRRCGIPSCQAHRALQKPSRLANFYCRELWHGPLRF